MNDKHLELQALVFIEEYIERVVREHEILTAYELINLLKDKATALRVEINQQEVKDAVSGEGKD